MAEMQAGALLPKPAVTPGMSESEAGEQLANYINAVSGGDPERDLDVFDGSLDPEQVTGEGPAASPPETATDEELERRAAAARAEEDEEGEAPGPSDEEQETDTGVDEDDAEAAGDAQAVTLDASQIAQLLGVDEDALVVGDDDGALRLRYKVDGQTGEATLGEVLASYQLQSHVNRKSEAVSEERRALREGIAQREQELQAAIINAGSFQKAMEDRLVERYSKVDWDRLKAEDPGRFAALQVEMDHEVQAIRAEAHRVQQEAAQQFQQSQADRAREHHAWLVEQQRQVFEHIPTLADEKLRDDRLREYHSYLTGLGFTADEIRGTQDARFLRVIDDAAAYRRMLAEKEKESDPPPLKKRLRKVPKVARPGGAPTPAGDARRARRQAAGKALRDSGSDMDAARFAVESGIADAVLGE